MEFVVYCDESRHDGSARNRFMAIGGLWVPRSLKPLLTTQLKALRANVGLKGEVKWTKVSAKKLDAYKALADFFFHQDDLRFRVIVVNQERTDYTKFHGNDRELGFYKFYFEMLEKWLLPSHRYLVLLDNKRNRGAERYTTLRRVLERSMKGKAWIDDLTIIDSYASPLAQLNDVLTGAVAAEWCGIDRASPKGELARYIGQLRGASLSAPDSSPTFSKMNVFAINLQ